MYKEKIKIAVSGAADVNICSQKAIELAREVGKEIVKQGCVLITGATTGVPYYSALGARENKGISIGFSPAASSLAHIKTYRLPVDAFDVIVYTGFGYAGRNLLMTRSADGVIIISGRMGTLNEFTICFEDEKPIGVLEGTGGIADEIRTIVKRPFRGKMNIIYSEDPKQLVKKIIDLVKKEKVVKR